MATASLLTLALKNLVDRPRPVWTDPVMTLNSYSFPSGHSLGHRGGGRRGDRADPTC